MENSFNGDFVHLHVHTEYSLLDGSGKIPDLLARTKELGMKSIAITDHGVMYGCVDFYKEAKEKGIKPIIGCEIYVAAKSMHDKTNNKENETHHLVLLVKNATGYQNLMKIVSKASIEGFYYKPRADHDCLREYSEGLIATSACLGGEVQSYLLSGNRNKAIEVALLYKDIFKDGFYLELQNHGIDEQLKVNEELIKLSKELDIPLICTNDVHYINKEDSKAHDILLCVQTGKTVDEENRMRYPSDEFYLKSPEEMHSIFSYVPEALNNTVKIAEQCNFDYEFHVSKLPKFPLPEGVDPFEYLREVCYKGLQERYPEITKELTDRLDYELGVIKNMGYVDYFLIVWDFIRFANENKIATGAGRGCFLPGTKILLANGTTTEIENIKKGDKVITAKGKALEVEEHLNYDCNEEITCVEAANEKLYLTNDHKVLSIKTSKCKKNWADVTKIPTVCRSTCNEYARKHCENPPFENYELTWNQAKELSKNDLIVYPRNQIEPQEIVFDILDYCNIDEHLRYDEHYIWYEIGSNSLESKKINRFIKFNEDFARLLGYFIAEGWTHIDEERRTYKLGFGFNREEVDYVNEVADLAKEIFGLDAYIREHRTRYATSIEFNSKPIAWFMRAICGEGANYKHIPYEIIENGSNELLRILIAYMFRGDGSFSDISCGSNSFRIKYTTTSYSLATQLRLVLARLGYWTSIKIREKQQENWSDEYSICVSGGQLLKWNEDFKNFIIPIRQQRFYRNDSFYVDENYIYIKVTKVSKQQYSGKVYDLSVPPDRSYVANSIAVHNSAAGSIVAYTLGITKIDPLKYSLLFERFLNPDRVSMPDIDSDFCYERRQEVIDYVVGRYGINNVSQIITFGTMAARACIRDVGRAMNYSYSEVDRIAKMIPTMLGITISKALDINPELKNAYENDERVKELIDVSLSLEGLPRHSGTHAAGVLIASQPLVNYVPMQKNEGGIVAQFPMGTLEELGLLKMDFLGLRTLTVMRDAVEMVKEGKGIDIDLDKLDFDDKEVYKMIGEGKTVGVFQLESPGMTSFMKDLKPDSLEDIIAGISLYRPGPMAEIPRYVDGKKNPGSVEYITPKLEEVLNVTYGVMVYQEQVIDIVRRLAGYSMGRADLVRRAMSKKKHKVMEEERRNFIHGIIDENGNVEVPGCVRNGISEEAANKIFDQMMDFASYAFNKSHAAAYAVIGFQTAYLMRYYPTEYIAAMLNSVMGTSEKVAFYIRFANELGIEVLPPDINESFAKFTVRGEKIRFGLAAVKNVGVNVIESIVKSREEKGRFISLTDFYNKIDVSLVNKRAIESLIKAGAFDDFKVYRSQMLAVYEKLLEGMHNDKKKNIQGQLSLFADFGEDLGFVEIQYPAIKEFEKKYLLAMEKEMTGLYLSGHPLEEFEETLKLQTNTRISEIVSSEALEEGATVQSARIRDGDRVVIGGMVSEISKKVTKNKDMMAFIKLEDMYGGVEVIIFPKVLRVYNHLIQEDAVIKITGRVSIREDEGPKILCETLEPLAKVSNEKVYILIDNETLRKETFEKMKNTLKAHRGNQPVFICTKKERLKFQVDDEYSVKTSEELLEYLKREFGEGNVKVQ